MSDSIHVAHSLGDVKDPAQRQRLVKQFNEDPSIFGFFLTTQVGGVGLTLTGVSQKNTICTIADYTGFELSLFVTFLSVFVFKVNSVTFLLFLG
jgi:hypothetical protein